MAARKADKNRNEFWKAKAAAVGDNPAAAAGLAYDRLRAVIAGLPGEQRAAAWRRLAEALDETRDEITGDCGE